MKLNLKRFHPQKRIIAAVLAGCILCTSVVYGRFAWYVNENWNQMQDMTFDPAIDAAIMKNKRTDFFAFPTGLTFEATYTYKKTEEIFSYSKFWASNHRNKAKKLTLPLAGSKENVTIDMSKFDKKYLSCIADHKDDYPPNSVAFFGGQLAIVGVYMPTNNKEDYPEVFRANCDAGDDMIKMKFNLILASLLHGESYTEEEVKDSAKTTADSALAFMCVRQIDGHGGFVMDSAEEDWNRLWQHSVEFSNAYNPTNQVGDPTISRQTSKCCEIS